jgi:hypothetical protein
VGSIPTRPTMETNKLHATDKYKQQIENLKEGKWYRFVYRRYGGRVNDECVAQFLGLNKSQYSITLVLNLRPAAGTSSLMKSQIIHIEPAKKNEPMLPRRCKEFDK